MPRGGARNGKQGKAYSNRTDMGGQNVVQPQVTPPSKLAVQASTGQAYGAASAQKSSQQSMPMSGTPQTPTTAAPGGTAEDTPTPQPLNSATTHGLPITHGMDIGPGAGSEALAPNLDTQVTIQALGLLNSLGDNVSPQVAMIRQYLQASATNGGTR